MTTAGLAAQLNEIHERVVAGSRTASRDLFLVALRPIKAYLLKSHSGLRDEDANDLATDTIVAYL